MFKETLNVIQDCVNTLMLHVAMFENCLKTQAVLI